jgi:flavodoxin long chain
MKTGLFFGSTHGEVASIAENIKAALGSAVSVYENIGTIDPKVVESCDALILGISTWDSDKLQEDWDAFWPKLEKMDLKGKKVAIFGLGDQVGYPDHYQDAVGLLADKVAARGAVLVGMTSPEGQKFTATKVMKDGKMRGLCLDILNQNDKTEARVATWVGQIKRELQLG